MADDTLQAEVERLRAEVETYRRQELEQLKVRLAAAEQAAVHYRQEAERNAEIGRQIHATAQEEINLLKTEIARNQKPRGHRNERP